MPNISRYLYERYGIAIYLYYGDVKQHKAPHIHVRYQGEEAVIAIPSGNLLDGGIANKALHAVRGWIGLNEDALMKAWHRAAQNKPIERID